MFLRDQFRGAGRDYRRALRRGVTIPLLSIHGELDQQVPLTAMRAAEEWVRAGHDLVSLPGVGHLPHEETPDAVTAAILAWPPTRRMLGSL